MVLKQSLSSKSQPKRHWQFIIWVLIAVSSCLGIVVSSFGPLFLVNPDSAIARATESALTAAHGTEAKLAIQRFIDRNWSFAAFRNPELLSEVATGQNLISLQKLRHEWSFKTVSVIRSSAINKVQVIDYAPSQFKAFSCEVLNFDTITIDGTFVSSDHPDIFFRIYVFHNEDGVWKVAAWADFTDADHITRDWTEGMYPQWEKDLIGDLPSLIDKYDSCFSP
jgi:hypothetical protein